MSSTLLSYRVAMPQPQTHFFEVTLKIKDWQQPQLHLQMPVWTPGSYMVREYSRHLQDFKAIDAHGNPLSFCKTAKNHWCVEGSGDLTISYRVFANDLTVRTNHLDASHGYFNPAALLFLVPDRTHEPIQIEIVPPAHWQVTTPLPGNNNIFVAQSFDELVDSPFEIGQHQVYDFEVLGKPHQLAIWGEGNIDVAKWLVDITKIVTVTAKIFGGLPYDRYLFLLHLSANGYGGLEHKNCCSLLYPRWQLQKTEQYEQFMQLVAHEFFHLWNVKRIFPKGLEKFDYNQENYTPSLWFSEGVTSYYDILMPRRAAIYGRSTLLAQMSKEISRFLTTPGRLVQPVTESSFDAWIKLYRPDANSSNSQMSYYLKGAMVALLLDLKIRALSNSEKSFDDVLVQLWQDYGQVGKGFTDRELESLIQNIAGVDLQDFYRDYLYSSIELPFDEYLQPFGLKISAVVSPIPYWGAVVKTEQGREMIKTVATGSPAALAGIDPGDELVAIDGYRVTADQLPDRLACYKVSDSSACASGDRIKVTVFHQDRLMDYEVELSASQPSKYELAPLPDLTPSQLYNLQCWAGAVG
jgi:predicted metalloprotease with PDZ domain